MDALTTLTFNGITRPLSAWARLTGVPATRIYNRLCLGWTTQEALFTPVGAERPKPAKRAYTFKARTPKAEATPEQAAPKGGAEAQDRGVGLDLQEKTGTGGGTVAQENPEIVFPYRNQEDAA